MGIFHLLIWCLAVRFTPPTMQEGSDAQNSMSFVAANSHLEATESLNKKLVIENERILYFDNDIIFVDKPAGLQTVPGFQDKHSLATIVSQMFKIKNIENMSPHRLDLQTSGVVVFARNLDALRGLSESFRNREVVKRYSAIINGTLEGETGEVKLPIGKDVISGPPLYTIDHSKLGRDAHTVWQKEEEGLHLTKVSLLPKTGRTHQLRLHMAAINHPILGDFFYSPPEVYTSAPRLLLHAEELVLKHPITKKELRVMAPSPFEPLQAYSDSMIRRRAILKSKNKFESK